MNIRHTSASPFLAVPIPESSPSRAQSSGSNSEVDSAVGGRRPGTRQSKSRSRNGCWTCRQRKVKCDEGRPTCSSCARLGRDCVWGQRWNFNDLNIRTRQKHKHVSTTGSPSWDGKSRMHLMARQLYAQHQPTLPPFIELRNEDERERKALSQPPGTFNVILTPDSFWQLPEYGGLIRRHWSSSGSSLSVSKFGFSEDPNLVILSEFEDTPYFMALPERGSSFTSLTTRMSSMPSTQRDFASFEPRDVDRVMTHYKYYISRRMMPLGARFMLSDCGNEDAIVQASRTFRPVSSASCRPERIPHTNILLAVPRNMCHHLTKPGAQGATSSSSESIPTLSSSYLRMHVKHRLVTRISDISPLHPSYI